MTRESILEKVAREVGCDATTAREVMEAGLRALHKHAFCNAESVEGAVLECFFNFGGQAAYHLGGLFEESRVNCDPELPWSETMKRIDSTLGRRHSLFVTEWLSQRTPQRKELDAGRSNHR